MNRYCSMAPIVTLTEVSRDYREKALHRPGWTVISGDKSGWDDCAIVIDNSRFKKIYSESFNMGGTGRYAQIAVILDLVTKKRLVWASVHYPASVETELSKNQRTADSILWTKCVWSLKRRVNYLKRKYKCAGAFIAADWNVNFKRAWVRRLIKSIHPFWKNAWREPWPISGTHHSRLIDATLFRGNVVLVRKARLLSDDNSSDHRPYVDTFR